ncbi:hypothetical protein BDN70DRAFT_874271 [Pholiota conissans]|uniref:Uncharacterized protein n=1 Tax=Pholiota conissans TaxID=109636 RepID=A0A9P6D4F0_9AGAR|nr:hypothetical protein BDN70DRAFT_874271 [Pholiota conissans]
MQVKSIIFFASQVVGIMALERRDNVFTALKVYHSIVDQSPYIVQATQTVVWTEGPSIIDTSLPTTAPTPTIGY